MPRDIVKVPVGCQHGQVVAEAELGQQRIDRSDLNVGSPAFFLNSAASTWSRRSGTNRRIHRLGSHHPGRASAKNRQ